MWLVIVLFMSSTPGENNNWYSVDGPFADRESCEQQIPKWRRVLMPESMYACVDVTDLADQDEPVKPAKLES